MVLTFSAAVFLQLGVSSSLVEGISRAQVNGLEGRGFGLKSRDAVADGHGCS
jgi:hypothetical protein